MVTVWLEVAESVFAAFGVMVFILSGVFTVWCVWQARVQRNGIREND
jgi:hypothetical protein